MAPQTNAAKAARFGLVLDLPGAPATPHDIPGLNGHFVPEVPVTLEEAGVTLEDARELDADEGFPVRLVELKASKTKAKSAAKPRAKKAADTPAPDETSPAGPPADETETTKPEEA